MTAVLSDNSFWCCFFLFIFGYSPIPLCGAILHFEL